jgi:4a-hydroxytetrahydrobiopterin dehydratase
MTARLVEQNCVPCRGGIPPLSLEEARQYLEQAPDWTLQDDGRLLQRTFRFANFRAALDFVRDAGELAEAERHHPDITFGWGYATISLRTKKIKGLHQNDFIMAAKLDRLAQASGAQENRGEQPRAAGAPLRADTASTDTPSNADPGSTLAYHR